MAEHLSAREIVEAILPDPNARFHVMNRLVRSWELAGAIAPNARSVTLWQDGFRLNIGQVEALAFLGDSFRLLLAAPVNDAKLEGLPVSPGDYRSFTRPHSVFNGSDFEYLAARELLDPLHEDYVDSAARTKNGAPRQGSPYLGSHSEELIAYAEELIRSAAAPTRKHPPQYTFVVGSKYTRRDVFAELGIKDHTGGPWFTGYASHNEDWFIFCGIGTGGRTGHDYNNHFQGDHLVWFAKGGTHLMQPTIERLLAPLGHVYLFYRENDRDPFTFAGTAHPVASFDQTPVKIIWRFRRSDADRQDYSLPEELDDENGTVIEGARKSVLVNIYERDLSARRKCIAHWRPKCCVCEFDFARMYGQKLGQGFIHVHHLKPLSEIGESYELNPIADLRPVCPNCHAMLHRRQPALQIDELKEIIAQGKAGKSKR